MPAAGLVLPRPLPLCEIKHAAFLSANIRREELGK